MTHKAHLEDRAHGYRVVCSCGWISEPMRQGDAWATKERGLKDKGHEAFARRAGAATGKRARS